MRHELPGFALSNPLSNLISLSVRPGQTKYRSTFVKSSHVSRTVRQMRQTGFGYNRAAPLVFLQKKTVYSTWTDTSMPPTMCAITSTMTSLRHLHRSFALTTTTTTCGKSTLTTSTTTSPHTVGLNCMPSAHKSCSLLTCGLRLDWSMGPVALFMTSSNHPMKGMPVCSWLTSPGIEAPLSPLPNQQLSPSLKFVLEIARECPSPSLGLLPSTSHKG
jgi:hypothetical protein